MVQAHTKDEAGVSEESFRLLVLSDQFGECTAEEEQLVRKVLRQRRLDPVCHHSYLAFKLSQRASHIRPWPRRARVGRQCAKVAQQYYLNE